MTILPAGQSLGATHQLPLVERHLYGEDCLGTALAGAAGGAGRPSSSSWGRIHRRRQRPRGATELAIKMVREFGLSPALGPVGYSQGGSVFLGGGGPGLSRRPFAEATQAAVDAEVARLLREAEQRATELLGTHRDELHRLVELLLDEETVDGCCRLRARRCRGTVGPAGPCPPPRPQRCGAHRGVAPAGSPRAGCGDPATTVGRTPRCATAATGGP